MRITVLTSLRIIHPHDSKTAAATRVEPCGQGLLPSSIKLHRSCCLCCARDSAVARYVNGRQHQKRSSVLKIIPSKRVTPQHQNTTPTAASALCLPRQKLHGRATLLSMLGDKTALNSSQGIAVPLGCVTFRKFVCEESPQFLQMPDGSDPFSLQLSALLGMPAWPQLQQTQLRPTVCVVLPSGPSSKSLKRPVTVAWSRSALSFSPRRRNSSAALWRFRGKFESPSSPGFGSTCASNREEGRGGCRAGRGKGIMTRFIGDSHRAPLTVAYRLYAVICECKPVIKKNHCGNYTLDNKPYHKADYVRNNICHQSPTTSNFFSCNFNYRA